jgi:tetratricopeptide (TPR) repeat protein
MGKDAAERIARAAAALDNQGNELFERGQFDKAMATYMKALKLKRRTFHSLLDDADDLLDDAILTSQEEALENGEQGATADQRLLLSMATSINNIGYLRQRAGDATPDETMQAYKKSLRIKQKILGKDSLSVGKTLNNIGSVHYLKGEFPGALDAYKEALQVMQSNLGDGHPDVATVWSNMGDVHLGMSLKTEALEHYRNALNIRWTSFGEHDPKVVRLLEKIAAIEIIDQMMANTPRRNTQNNDHFDWDESDLYDLDALPMGKELHLLRDQVEQDMQFVDLMEKQMAVDMVKDKVQILKGMRELMEGADDKEDNKAKDNGEENHHEKDHNEQSVIDGGKSHDKVDGDEREIHRTESMTTDDFEHLADDRNADRIEALHSVKRRLAAIREQKSHVHDMPSSSSSSSMGHASMPDLGHPTTPTSSRNLFGASFYHDQTRMTSLATFDKDDLKEGIESLRSALMLRQGIAELKRSSSIAEE